MLHKISTSYSTDKIRRAKKQSDHIFSTVSIFNLLFEDKSLIDFEVNYKFRPPLRDGATLKSLVKGVLDRSIDIIVSDHTPWDTEKKDLEFQQSAFGSINLETAYASLRTFGDKVLTDEIWVECVAIRPRQIFNLPSTSIQINEKADLCWFHPETEWKYTSENIHSKSKNTPYPGVTFKGKALGIYCKNNFYDNR
jgi:dihydroorotase